MLEQQGSVIRKGQYTVARKVVMKLYHSPFTPRMIINLSVAQDTKPNKVTFESCHASRSCFSLFEHDFTSLNNLLIVKIRRELEAMDTVRLNQNDGKQEKVPLHSTNSQQLVENIEHCSNTKEDKNKREVLIYPVLNWVLPHHLGQPMSMLQNLGEENQGR